MDLKKELCQVADVTRGRISRAQTFSDFLAYCALLLSSRTDPVHSKDSMEQLQRLKGSYHDAEWQAFHHTLCSVCDTARRNVDCGCYEDLFADAYTELGASSRALKQDFTPKSIAMMMAQITTREGIKLPEEGYFTLSDHACGSGILLLAEAERIAQCGFNPAMQLVVQAADLDIRCVHMTCLNLSLNGIPAVVIHGNTITLQKFSRWYTPAYLLGKWVWREPMLFGDGGYTSNELLKMADEPIYRAFRLLTHIGQPTEDAAG